MEHAFVCDDCDDNFEIVVKDANDENLVAMGEDAFKYHLSTEHGIEITDPC